MSAPKVDVLAVLDAEITDLSQTSDAEEVREYGFRQREAVLREARAAVAELIDADREYDMARADWRDGERYDVDSYGIPGSDFFICRYCENESGAGLLNKGVSHEEDCKVAALEHAEARREAALTRIGSAS
ncbi:hypothetical protein ACO2Q2_17490 [Dyella sp. KRB-257]|uniref:hypothetical protein n=1 Tax=Dyella sp. KRB-257 TaxID=3400915 RepID=UPI003C0A5EEA